MNPILDISTKMIEVAKVKAASMNIQVSIAVVDSGGHLVALNRMDGTPFGINEFAIRKARTAISFGADSGMVGTVFEAAGIHSLGMQNTNGGLVTIGGGVVLRDNQGKAMGAIGVSGGAIEQDIAIAHVGVEVFVNT